MANGIVEWRAVNIDQPGNKHFEKDFGLKVQSLVLVRLRDGQPAESKNLEAVWELLGDYAGSRNTWRMSCLRSSVTLRRRPGRFSMQEDRLL